LKNSSYTFAEHMLRYHPNSETARLWKRVQELETIASALDEMVATYPREGKWDDALVTWAYEKGFNAGKSQGR